MGSTYKYLFKVTKTVSIPAILCNVAPRYTRYLDSIYKLNCIFREKLKPHVLIREYTSWAVGVESDNEDYIYTINGDVRKPLNEGSAVLRP